MPCDFKEQKRDCIEVFKKKIYNRRIINILNALIKKSLFIILTLYKRTIKKIWSAMSDKRKSYGFCGIWS